MFTKNDPGHAREAALLSAAIRRAKRDARGDSAIIVATDGLEVRRVAGAILITPPRSAEERVAEDAAFAAARWQVAEVELGDTQRGGEPVADGCSDVSTVEEVPAT